MSEQASPNPPEIELATTASESETYIVQPTGPSDGQSGLMHTDIGIIGLFGHHVTNMNSVRQAIWQRYAAMLLANSFAIGLINTASANEAKVAGAMFGIVGCTFWLLVFMADAIFLQIRMREASRFSWPKLGSRANPVTTMRFGIEAQIGEDLFTLARRLIYVFMLLYGALLAIYVRSVDFSWMSGR